MVRAAVALAAASQAVGRNANQQRAPVLAPQHVVLEPVTRREPLAAPAHARERQLGPQVAERPHALLVVKREMAVQQVLLKVVGSVELPALVGALVAAKRAGEPALLLVRAHVARQVPPEVLAADLALVFFLHGHVGVVIDDEGCGWCRRRRGVGDYAGHGAAGLVLGEGRRAGRRHGRGAAVAAELRERHGAIERVPVVNLVVVVVGVVSELARAAKVVVQVSSHGYAIVKRRGGRGDPVGGRVGLVGVLWLWW